MCVCLSLLLFFKPGYCTPKHSEIVWCCSCHAFPFTWRWRRRLWHRRFLGSTPFKRRPFIHSLIHIFHVNNATRLDYCHRIVIVIIPRCHCSRRRCSSINHVYLTYSSRANIKIFGNLFKINRGEFFFCLFGDHNFAGMWLLWRFCIVQRKGQNVSDR